MSDAYTITYQINPCPLCGHPCELERTITEVCIRCKFCRLTLTRDAITKTREITFEWNNRVRFPSPMAERVPSHDPQTE